MTTTEASEHVRNSIRGPVPAMTTPFNDDLSVDLDGLRELTHHYSDAGIETVIVAGSTGEFFSLTDEERKDVIETVVDAAGDDLAVIAGCAHSGTQLTLDLVEFSEDIGADGVMVTPPYYSFAGFEGLKRHYEIISEETDIGIVIYFSGSVLRFPTINDMVEERWSCPDQLKELTDIANVGAFKDATGNFGFHRDVIQEIGGPDGDVEVIGSDGMGYHIWGHMHGSRSFIAGLGNVWPEVEVEFFEKLEAGDYVGALQLVDEKEVPYLYQTKATGRYWAAVKSLLDMEDLPGGGPMRPPLLDTTEEHDRKLREMAVQTGLLSTAAEGQV